MFYLLFLDYGLSLKKKFSGKFWASWARLSYLIYLLFPIIAGEFSSSMHSALYLTYSEMIFLMLYNVSISTIIAGLIYMACEFPIASASHWLLYASKSNYKDLAVSLKLSSRKAPIKKSLH
mmetsp:Transcript_10363/g.15940  ORF Transcript_10363/g.15940 Transcript_10363/m.15940 type:complete len:121 (+) Transcript_10363:2379-2741(+)